MGYLEHLKNGHTRGYAATLVGLHRKTSEAESDAIGKVENALFEAATSGNVTAMQVYLYNRDPKRWTDKRNTRLAGEGGGPIEVKHDTEDARKKLLAELNRYAARAREAQGDKQPEREGS